MDIIEKFIKTKNGKATYRSWLKKYFEVIETEPNNYFSKRRKYNEDVLKFANAIGDWAPATKKSSIACLKNFLMYNDVEISPKVKYELKERCHGPKTISRNHGKRRI
jgi:hypothetical protein